MVLTDGDKKLYLQKAIDIAIASCVTTTSADELTEIIQKTYDKIMEIAINT